jgi:ribosomal protein L1
VENATCSWPRAALQLGFDAPGEVGAVVLPKDLIRNQGVGVFRVNEKTVHVENAGADAREAGVTNGLVEKKKGGGWGAVQKEDWDKEYVEAE